LYLKKQKTINKKAMEEFLKIIESNQKLKSLENELIKLVGQKTVQECREKLIKSHDFCSKTNDYSVFLSDYETELFRKMRDYKFINKIY
jgi:coenzyme F420-reducing hydrogenase alpha subunit